MPLLLTAAPVLLVMLARRSKKKGARGAPVDVKKITSSDLGELLPDVRAKAEAVLGELRAQGFDPRVYETYRSPERADYLAQIGRSKAGRASYHVKRRALDVVDNRRDSRGDRVLWGASTGKGNDAERKALADSFFRAFGAAVKKHGGTWGGDWSFYDPAHAQW